MTTSLVKLGFVSPFPFPGVVLCFVLYFDLVELSPVFRVGTGPPFPLKLFPAYLQLMYFFVRSVMI